MSYLPFLGVNLVAATAREVLSKKVVSKIDPYVMFFYFALFNGLWLFAFHKLYYRQFPTINFETVLTGLAPLVAYIAYLKAMQYSLSRSILFQSYSVIVTIVLAALFLGELQFLNPQTLSGQKLIVGLILAVVSLKFLLSAKAQENKIEKRWLVYMLLTIVFMGTGSYFTVFFARQMPVTAIFVNQAIFMIPVSLLLILWSKKSLLIPKVQFLHVSTISFFQAVAYVSFFEASLELITSKLFPIQQIALVILTMIASFFLFKERELTTVKKVIGSVIGVIGILITASA
jgi:drug/metabolite transporter (DMT)-like permease